MSMKVIGKLCGILVIAVSLISCSKEDVPNRLSDSSKCKVIGSDNVLKYANAKFGKTKGSAIIIDPVCVDNDTLAFILNYGEGWELISGDENYTPIIAKGDGTFIVENLNPGQKVWLDLELETIRAVKNNQMVLDSSEVRKNNDFWKRIKTHSGVSTKAEGDPDQGWELIEIIEIGAERNGSGHLIKTQWGQRYPWNQVVPYGDINNRCVAGCVAVAGAQMLKFLHDTLGKPATFYTMGECLGSITSPLYTFGNLSLDAWNNMALTSQDQSSHLYQSALLIGWVGKEIGTNYSISASSAQSVNLKGLLEDLSIHCNFGTYNSDIVLDHLRQGWPLYIEAYTQSEVGHAWIIDGYEKVTTEYRYIYEFQDRDAPYNEYGEIKYETVYESNNYILMNWGWNNRIDNTCYTIYSGSGWNEGGYTFVNNKRIMYNFN